MPNFFGFHHDKHEKTGHKFLGNAFNFHGAHHSDKEASSSQQESTTSSSPQPEADHTTTPPQPQTVAVQGNGTALPSSGQSSSSVHTAMSSVAPSIVSQDQLSTTSPSVTAPTQAAAVTTTTSATATKPSSNSSAPINPSTGLPMRQLSGRYKLQDFTIKRTLGTGSFGRVHLVQSVHNHRFYAIKVLRKSHVVKMKQVEHVINEHDVLAMVRHPFLVNLWGTFQDPTFLYMVMDFVPGGELFSLLRQSRRFPPQVAKFYISEVILAIDFLHKHHIVYRDLKPENILIGVDGHLKLIDFGFAKVVTESNGMCWTLCGTPDYLAPEIIRARGYNASVDWWSVGILLFEMLAGYPPFYTEDNNPIKLYEKILAGYVEYPSYFEAGAKDLLKSLITADLSKRFGNLHRGSRDIFSHMWFAEIDWDCLYRKEIPAPYIPNVGTNGDASQFDKYPENDLSEYSQPNAVDEYPNLFPGF
ncbi:cAMP-dependent protein kinase catalytic subunit [Malassezia pachydermatis]|uniref:cAMP-dependent protein kinase n=1 Tax=Malassezia pachydermatis TaxID=77020 RepID=A0A0M8MV97_9BASI|nr:agc pka protein kinase [Malassezia pachydermatis]KOS14460.1 agc pka protein kinase [Malassezia pachydermatis]